MLRRATRLLLFLALLTQAARAESISEPARQLPVTHHADVVVIGADTGGLGGVTAAVAAARAGAKVILIAEGGSIGLHVPIGLGVAIGIRDWRPTIREGLFKEFAGYVAREGQFTYTPMSEHELLDKGEIIIRYHDVVSTAAIRMLQDAGVQILFHAKFAGTVVENGRIKAVIVESPQGRHAIAGKAFVDSTGLGDVAASAGAPMLREEPYMGVQAFIGNVDTHAYFAFADDKNQPPLDESYTKWMENVVGPFKDLKHPWEKWFSQYLGKRTPAAVVRRLRAAQEKGEFKLIYRRGQGILAIAEGIKASEGIAMPRTYITGIDPLNVNDVSWAEASSREALMEFQRVLKAHVPGFEHCVMERMADIVSERGGRYIQTSEKITGAEIERGGQNPDCIYVLQRGKDRPAYEVPYRALVPQKVDNLLVVGKATAGGVDLRTAHGVLFQGQAAGIACAIVAKDGMTMRAVDIGKLQAALRAAGVDIPDHAKPASPAGVLRTQHFDQDPH